MKSKSASKRTPSGRAARSAAGDDETRSPSRRRQSNTKSQTEKRKAAQQRLMNPFEDVPQMDWMRAVRGRGRPTNLNDGVANRIADLVARGNNPRTAATACGVKPRTFDGWIAKGRQDPTSVFGQFVAALDQAKAAAECRFVEAIRQQPNRWQALAWILERRSSARWGPPQVGDAAAGGETDPITPGEEKLAEQFDLGNIDSLQGVDEALSRVARALANGEMTEVKAASLRSFLREKQLSIRNAGLQAKVDEMERAREESRDDVGTTN